MRFLSKLFGNRPEVTSSSAESVEHAVIVHFQYGLDDLAPLRAVEDRLDAAITSDGTGEYDGDEIAVDLSDGFLYMYGPDADALFASIHATLEQVDFMTGARITLRYGPPADCVREQVVILDS